MLKETSYNINMKTQYIKINKIGDKFYYSDEKLTKLHREDAPAIEFANGSKYWCVDGKIHREDGPAAELGNGSKYWYVDGKLHRENGPAVEDKNGYKYWYLHDIEYTEQEHAKRTKKVPTININGKTTQEELTAVTNQLDAVLLELGETQERMFDAQMQRDKLAEALDRIARPVWWMQEDQKRKTGSINGINGAMALALSEDQYYLKLIATEALRLLEKTKGKKVS